MCFTRNWSTYFYSTSSRSQEKHLLILLKNPIEKHLNRQIGLPYKEIFLHWKNQLVTHLTEEQFKVVHVKCHRTPPRVRTLLVG